MDMNTKEAESNQMESLNEYQGFESVVDDYEYFILMAFHFLRATMESQDSTNLEQLPTLDQVAVSQAYESLRSVVMGTDKAIDRFNTAN